MKNSSRPVNHFVILEPVSEIFHVALDLLKKQKGQESLEIIYCSTPEQAANEIREASPCVVGFSIEKMESAATAINFMRSIADKVDAKEIKVIAVNKVSTPALTKLLDKVKLSVVVTEPVPTRTLMFKLLLQIKAVELVRKQLELKAKQEERISFNGSRKSEKDEDQDAIRFSLGGRQGKDQKKYFGQKGDETSPDDNQEVAGLDLSKAVGETLVSAVDSEAEESLPEEKKKISPFVQKLEEEKKQLSGANGPAAAALAEGQAKSYKPTEQAEKKKLESSREGSTSDPEQKIRALPPLELLKAKPSRAAASTQVEKHSDVLEKLLSPEEETPEAKAESLRKQGKDSNGAEGVAIAGKESRVGQLNAERPPKPGRDLPRLVAKTKPDKKSQLGKKKLRDLKALSDLAGGGEEAFELPEDTDEAEFVESAAALEEGISATEEAKEKNQKPAGQGDTKRKSSTMGASDQSSPEDQEKEIANSAVGETAATTGLNPKKAITAKLGLAEKDKKKSSPSLDKEKFKRLLDRAKNIGKEFSPGEEDPISPDESAGPDEIAEEERIEALIEDLSRESSSPAESSKKNRRGDREEGGAEGGEGQEKRARAGNSAGAEGENAADGRRKNLTGKRSNASAENEGDLDLPPELRDNTWSDVSDIADEKRKGSLRNRLTDLEDEVEQSAEGKASSEKKGGSDAIRKHKEELLPDSEGSWVAAGTHFILVNQAIDTSQIAAVAGFLPIWVFAGPRPRSAGKFWEFENSSLSQIQDEGALPPSVAEYLRKLLQAVRARAEKSSTDKRPKPKNSAEEQQEAAESKLASPVSQVAGGNQSLKKESPGGSGEAAAASEISSASTDPAPALVASELAARKERQIEPPSASPGDKPEASDESGAASAKADTKEKKAPKNRNPRDINLGLGVAAEDSAGEAEAEAGEGEGSADGERIAEGESSSDRKSTAGVENKAADAALTTAEKITEGGATDANEANGKKLPPPLTLAPVPERAKPETSIGKIANFFKEAKRKERDFSAEAIALLARLNRGKEILSPSEIEPESLLASKNSEETSQSAKEKSALGEVDHAPTAANESKPVVASTAAPEETRKLDSKANVTAIGAADPIEGKAKAEVSSLLSKNQLPAENGKTISPTLGIVASTDASNQNPSPESQIFPPERTETGSTRSPLRLLSSVGPAVTLNENFPSVEQITELLKRDARTGEPAIDRKLTRAEQIAQSLAGTDGLKPSRSRAEDLARRLVMLDSQRDEEKVANAFHMFATNIRTKFPGLQVSVVVAKERGALALVGSEKQAIENDLGELRRQPNRYWTTFRTNTVADSNLGLVVFPAEGRAFAPEEINFLDQYFEFGREILSAA